MYKYLSNSFFLEKSWESRRLLCLRVIFGRGLGWFLGLILGFAKFRLFPQALCVGEIAYEIVLDILGKKVLLCNGIQQ